MREFQPGHKCPACQGHRVDYNLKHARLAKCELCGGRGYVPSVCCKGCGKPAYKFWPLNQYPIIQYCGMESCFTKLVHLHLPAKKAEKKAEPPRLELEVLKKDIMRRNSELERTSRAAIQHFFGPVQRIGEA